ncbi:MAG: RNA polymerase sigma factor RpoH [Hyphomonadaceae bacterium]|nr:RNA polymerase sigma factor RpoH [Hyphomonadaceae bacterium]
MASDNTTLPAKRTSTGVSRDASYSGNLSMSVALSPEQGLNNYLAEIRKFPILEKDEEFILAKRWAEDGDKRAAEKMVTSHLRLVAKVAMGYRGYGLPIGEIISEGNVGLMQAVRKFDPDKGFRLSTYAMWWIRAAIQEYVLRSWSLVKIGTTAAQKKLFFNLRRLKGEMKAIDDGDLPPDQVKKIATRLNVRKDEVTSMNRRMSHGGDASLNATVSGDDDSAEWQDWLEDETESQEAQFARSQEFDRRMELLQDAMADLNDRERHIFSERRLSNVPKTLEELAGVYNLSRERIRQIETRAFEKLEEAMLKAARKAGLIEAS